MISRRKHIVHLERAPSLREKYCTKKNNGKNVFMVLRITNDKTMNYFQCHRNGIIILYTVEQQMKKKHFCVLN
jgi:hypothetical protein